MSTLENYIVDGHFTQTVINSEPALTLLLYFVVPRCLIYIAFMTVYSCPKSCDSLPDRFIRIE